MVLLCIICNCLGGDMSNMRACLNLISIGQFLAYM